MKLGLRPPVGKPPLENRVGPPLVAATGVWRRGSIPRVPSPGGDPGRSRHLPRLERVGPWHARWYGPRVPEPEVMDAIDEAEAYRDAVAEEHLARLDAGWVERILAAGPRGPARVLDVGAGDGSIVADLAARRPAWRVWAVDRSPAMLAAGQAAIGARRADARRRARPFRLGVAVADGRSVPAADGSFDLVLSNSLLHHLADPRPVLDEIARIAAPGGRVVLRDLRRPGRLVHRQHVAWHGRRYRGAMRGLYAASVAAAFTVGELAILVRHSALSGAWVSRDGPYLIVEW